MVRIFRAFLRPIVQFARRLVNSADATDYIEGTVGNRFDLFNNSVRIWSISGPGTVTQNEVVGNGMIFATEGTSIFQIGVGSAFYHFTDTQPDADGAGFAKTDVRPPARRRRDRQPCAACADVQN